tara:strand:- start:168 stop:431 length:264 start_codon:yes stop_codon:yes gene_type:complete
MFLEVLNALKYKKDQQDKLSEVNMALQNMQFLIIPLNFQLLRKATEISIDYDLSVYDALYAAIAQVFECELITVDNDFENFPNVVSL